MLRRSFAYISCNTSEWLRGREISAGAPTAAGAVCALGTAFSLGTSRATLGRGALTRFLGAGGGGGGGSSFTVFLAPGGLPRRVPGATVVTSTSTAGTAAISTEFPEFPGAAACAEVPSEASTLDGALKGAGASCDVAEFPGISLLIKYYLKNDPCA
jgi:hypothetical protein